MTIAVTVEISPAELIDKITILRIKAERMHDPAKLRHVHAELEALSAAAERSLPPSPDLAALMAQLMKINETIWEVEDQLRAREREQQFDAAFIDSARAVYRNNDRRAELKRQINELLGSRFVEVKDHPAY